MERHEYDVFVSYQRTDQSYAAELVANLRDVGLKVWWDEDVRPGTPWIMQLHEGIKRSSSTVVLIGKDDISAWVKQEVIQALAENVDRGSRIIPVILPGATAPGELPGFLPLYQWVNCNESRPFRGVLDDVVTAVTGLETVRELSQMGKKYDLEVPRTKLGLRSTMRVFEIPRARRRGKVFLSWSSFTLGITHLAKQLDQYGARVEVDACIGVNDAGLIIATTLNGSVLHRRDLGYVRSRRQGSREVRIEDALLPRTEPHPVLLVADFSLKSGTHLRAVTTRLEEEYGEPRIFFAVFAALTAGDEPRIANLDGLEAADVIKDLEIEDIFLAATMAPPGIAPPSQLH